MQLRSQIVETACAIAKKEGWPAVSVRKIADAIEYSAPILYEYFENKESLLEAIRRDGFAQLNAGFRDIKALYRSPEKQLTEVALLTWEFARNRPEVFEVMFNLGGAYSASKEVYAAEMSHENNVVWEMIAAFKPRFAESVNKTYQEWWVVTFGFIIIKMTVALKESNGYNENLYMENVRRYLRSVL